MDYDIVEIAEQLASVRPKILEHKFRDNFLPFFLQRIEPALVPTAISAWVGGVAGSTTMPVDVVDNHGNVLFTVPPIINTSAVQITDGNHFTYIAGVSTLMRANQPEVADTLVDTEIGKAMSDSLEINTVDEWDPILRYYNLLPPKEVPVATKEQENILGDLGL